MHITFHKTIQIYRQCDLIVFITVSFLLLVIKVLIYVIKIKFLVKIQNS